MALALRFPNAATSNQRRQVIPPSQGAVLHCCAPTSNHLSTSRGGPFASDSTLQSPMTSPAASAGEASAACPWTSSSTQGLP